MAKQLNMICHPANCLPQARHPVHKVGKHERPKSLAKCHGLKRRGLGVRSYVSFSGLVVSSITCWLAGRAS